MTFVLSFLGQKGGTGKSTLARLVGRQYVHEGNTVKIADLDVKQSTSTHWYTRRAQLEGEPPHVPVQPFAKIPDALAAGALLDLLILDPGASDGRIREIAISSTYIVIPTSCSTDDLDPSVALARELVALGIPRDRIGLALCRTTGSAAVSAATRELIAGQGFDALPGEMPTKTTYEEAASLGRAANETRYPGLNERAEALARSIMDRLEAIAAQDQPQQKQGVA